MMGAGDDGMTSQQSSWFIIRWKAQLVTGLALVEGVFALVNSISLFSPMCIIAGVLQLIAAICVLAIEAPTFVSFIRFAQPIGYIFENRPAWIKFVLYLALAIIPCLFNCFGLSFLLAFVSAMAIACVYGALLIGPKGVIINHSTSGDPYSPTSP